MPKRKVIPFKREPYRTCWHTYSLQDLQPERFLRVATQILAGKLTFVPLVRSESDRSF